MNTAENHTGDDPDDEKEAENVRSEGSFSPVR